MLDELQVRNLGLIEEATVEPGGGFVVVTGETGTGKTLLLGALRLLRGEPARKDQIGPAGDEARVEGRFVVDGVETTLGRRVGAARSRAYLDGAMVPVKALARKMEHLVEIVGQHDHLRLADRSALLGMVDSALTGAERGAVAAYERAWEHLVELRARADLIGGDRRALERELDMLRFQIDEIEGAAFAPGDDVELDRTASRLRNAEELGAHLAAAAGALGDEGAAGALHVAVRELTAAARLDPDLGAIADQLTDLAGILADAGTDVARRQMDLDVEPAVLEEVERRLALLGDLRRKYGDDLDDVLAFAERARARVAELGDLLEEAEELGGRIDRAAADVADAAEALTAVRVKAAERIRAGALEHLRELGFSSPLLGFTFERVDPGPRGADRVELGFSSDDTLAPAPIGRVASGGELSRIVLAVRLAAASATAEVLAFDEIDAGVGGVTALAMGRKLADLARGRQVLCVTHLPQVAAFADHHLVVERTGTTATVRRVDGEARLEELSRMLSGLPDSIKGREHAAELLELAASATR